MKRKIGKLVLGLLFMVASFAVTAKVSAESINYQALKYGTQQTSMASNYYVKPANVTANGDQYLVTMTIHTSTQLGEWPVTVLSINGQGPANVSKTKSASGYDYSYAFQTADLSQTISSSISIDVPKVYTANHDISFKFDTSNLPALNSTASSATTASSSSAVASSASQSSASSQSVASSSSSQSSSASNSVASSSSQKVAAKTTSDKVTKKQNAQIAALNRKNKQTQTAIVTGGSVAVVILAVAAYFFTKRK
ncbi:NEAT domain-containing protein [Loigolactobacillus jiayinensis]|uniref:NEAT domain-containing protein n=1 Tax=Loigolactobacillus jiayinensis TaxID=2486016 RepID=A0ABW1RJG6_9LACO|nr:NEAT domain-containing protein [Loigolactobacillus jiayinensis]